MLGYARVDRFDLTQASGPR